MTRPKVHLIDPQTRRLVPLRPEPPDGGMFVVTLIVALVFGLVAGFSLAAWVLAL